MIYPARSVNRIRFRITRFGEALDRNPRFIII
jgi:hypothetical protein